MKVFHKADTGLEDLTSTASVDANGTLTFKTSSFSPFAVVVERIVEDDGEESDWNSDFSTCSSTYDIDVTNKVVYIGETITLTGSEAKGKSSQHQWYVSAYDGQIEIVSGGQSQTMTARGVKVGTVTVTHYYTNKKGRWSNETTTITVADKNADKNATVFILLTPGSHRDSNNTDQWGYGIVGAKVDISNATGWVDNNKNLKINLDTYIKSWPNNGDVVTLQDGKKAWDMPLNTIGYGYADKWGNQDSVTILDQIWSQWSDEIKKQADGTTLDGLKKSDIKHVYVVPYKISRSNGTSGTGSTQIKDLHIDSEIRIVCDGIFTARF